MKSTDLAIALSSTLGSIIFFSALEARSQPSSISKSLEEQAPNISRSSSPTSLPTPFQTDEGDLRYPAPDLKAPGANPSFDEIGTLHWELEARPFAVTVEKGDFGWTAEDGLKESVMGQLSNNMDMLEAMREDNATAMRRQLVYHNSGLEEKRKAILDGELNTLELPDFNGDTFQIEILSSTRMTEENHPDELDNGYIGGRVQGQPSKVTIGMSGSSYSIHIQTEDRFIDIITRKNGEMIVTEHDPVLQSAVPSDPCRFGHGQGVGEIIN